MNSARKVKIPLAKKIDATKFQSFEYSKALYVDVETTGLNSLSDEIIEFAGCLFVYHKLTGEIYGVVDTYSSLRDPKKQIPLMASAVNGISNEMVRGKKLNDARINILFGQADFIVAHNAQFDKGFVTKLYPKLGKHDWRCSIENVDWRKEGCQSRSLDNLCKHYNIEETHAHRAEIDVLRAITVLSLKSQKGTPFFLSVLEGKSVGRR